MSSVISVTCMYNFTYSKLILLWFSRSDCRRLTVCSVLERHRLRSAAWLWRRSSSLLLRDCARRTTARSSVVCRMSLMTATTPINADSRTKLTPKKLSSGNVQCKKGYECIQNNQTHTPTPEQNHGTDTHGVQKNSHLSNSFFCTESFLLQNTATS